MSTSKGYYERNTFPLKGCNKITQEEKDNLSDRFPVEYLSACSNLVCDINTIAVYTCPVLVHM